MSWSRYPLPDNLPTTTRCIQLEIPDDKEYTQLLVGALAWLGFWDAYDRDDAKRGKDVAALWRAALDSLTFCDGPTPEYITETIEKYIGGLVEIESEEDMANLRIEVIDGVPYLEEDCGCGVRKYYGLTQSTVNPQTGAIAGELDTPPSYIQQVPLTQDQIDDCYADSVASIITGALVEYTNQVFNYAVLGAAAFAPGTTGAIIGAIEVQQAIVAALNGNLTLDFSNIGYTANEVIAVFEGTAFQTFLKDRLGDDQQVARWVLDLVALRLLNNNSLNFPTPTYPVFAAWVRMVNIAELNNQLQIAATSCETGNAVPESEDFDYDWVFDYEFPANYSDQMGWIPGRTPQNASYGNYSADGWSNAVAGGHRQAIGIKYAEDVLILTAAIITMNQPLGGDFNKYRAFIHPGTTPPIEDALDGTGKSELLVVLDGDPYDYLELEVNVNETDANPATGYFITRVRLYGIGSKPTAGTEIT